MDEAGDAGYGVVGWGRVVLGEAGIGAACTAVSLLSTLDDAGHLQTCVHGEGAVPHLQGAI